MKTNITIKDIAKEAGVSTAVVSVALSNVSSNTRMSQETRERIRKIAQKYNYHSSITARGFQLKKTYLLALFFTPHSDYILSRLLLHLRNLCYKHEYDVIVYPNETLEMERSGLESAFSRKPDGILTAPFVSDEGDNLATYRELAATGTPVVQLFYRLTSEFPYFGRDYESIGKNAVRTLFRHGHRRIALFVFENYPDPRLGWSSYGVAYGCKAEAAASRVELTIIPVHYRNLEFLHSSSEYAEKFLALPESARPTAAIFSNSSLAGKIFGHFQKRGVKVPEEISMISCADDIEQERSLFPELSCFKVPVGEIVRAGTGKCLSFPDAPEKNEIFFDSLLSGEKTICDFHPPKTKRKEDNS